MKNINIELLKNYKARSKWMQGVKEYAEELAESVEGLDDLFFDTFQAFERELLSGANNWMQYSWGGCSLIYNGDICKRLSTPSEQKKTSNGERRPNSSEEWLDVQARALYQAARLLWCEC